MRVYRLGIRMFMRLSFYNLYCLLYNAIGSSEFHSIELIMDAMHNCQIRIAPFSSIAAIGSVVWISVQDKLENNNVSFTSRRLKMVHHYIRAGINTYCFSSMYNDRPPIHCILVRGWQTACGQTTCCLVL